MVQQGGLLGMQAADKAYTTRLACSTCSDIVDEAASIRPVTEEAYGAKPAGAAASKTEVYVKNTFTTILAPTTSVAQRRTSRSLPPVGPR